MSGTTTNAYLRNTVLTASPEQLHLMLYDGAIRFAMQGRDALVAEDHEGSYEALSRAQAIMIEMLNGLRPEVNPELCERMAGLYSFIHRRLVEAGVHKDPAGIDDALTILRHQRETWVMLVEKVTRLRAESEEPPPGDASEADGLPVGVGLSVEG